MSKIRVVSLFAGIGGFEEGFKKAKIKADIVFASEINSFARQSYIANFSNKNLYGDITKIDEKDIPSHDLLVAGFTCQSFSIAGKQKGFDDIRGTLFF
ncbi:DNA (cytosine-5-)-methyltransferase [Campylobacter sp. LR291e]|nr:DNA (cytosine-5-)-methyltransferase [Campylobacter sp. LR196d]KAA6228519.1 DNA (cytosine-5-)-methyltransferase [Campylobacter sp. LR286c]KAA6230910.1 DNA (cytosine-5-)-methyltransferase [Campylobacter sp. LR291e]KAA6233544.1 DNA (cytosine-5-)-methyltransferase [Campylobacter sp. LR264d]